jgi:beta-propeller uncharacterized protein DUF5122
VQADGKILVGGLFTGLGGGTGTTTRNNIGRLNADGSLDTNFNPGANNWVWAIAVQSDGTLLVGGAFTTLGGGGTGTTVRCHIGLLTSTDAATQRLSVTGGGSIVTWARSGAAPEVWRATFEVSTDGATYTSLASGTHMPGGWQATGQSLPINQNLFIRARGYYATGYGNGSGSIVESVQTAYVTPPTISSLPDTPTMKDTPITVSFTVGDTEVGASAVTVFTRSSNAAAVPTANLVLGGTGASRTLTITPAPHQLGATTVTLTASDGCLATSTSFVWLCTATCPAILADTARPTSRSFGLPTARPTRTIRRSIRSSEFRWAACVSKPRAYYNGQGVSDRVRIDIPLGCYEPLGTFVRLSPPG